LNLSDVILQISEIRHYLGHSHRSRVVVWVHRVDVSGPQTEECQRAGSKAGCKALICCGLIGRGGHLHPSAIVVSHKQKRSSKLVLRLRVE
jgi:hypothetical protein